MPTLEYKPDRVSPPGDTLQDILDERGISQTELAARLDRSEKNLSQVVNGKAPITPQLALDLELALGVPARFWLNRESTYREALAREAESPLDEEVVAWGRLFPYNLMAKRAWVPETRSRAERARNLLRFFGVVSKEAFDRVWTGETAIQYRRSTHRPEKPQLAAAWLRRGEIEAEANLAAPYSEKLFVEAVQAARGWTALEPKAFVPRLKAAFSAAGVTLLFVRELPGMGISGATRWLSPDWALIQITLRFRTNDHLWFTLFHECCHILKHSKKRMFLEDGGKEVEETEADRFAADHLIRPADWRRLRSLDTYGRDKVTQFAKEVDIHPGIVVGRLQHEGLVAHSVFNDLKVRYQWVVRDE